MYGYSEAGIVFYTCHKEYALKIRNLGCQATKYKILKYLVSHLMLSPAFRD
jgi:hypothetical protein